MKDYLIMGDIKKGKSNEGLLWNIYKRQVKNYAGLLNCFDI